MLHHRNFIGADFILNYDMKVFIITLRNIALLEQVKIHHSPYAIMIMSRRKKPWSNKQTPQQNVCRYLIYYVCSFKFLCNNGQQGAIIFKKKIKNWNQEMMHKWNLLDSRTVRLQRIQKILCVGNLQSARIPSFHCFTKKRWTLDFFQKGKNHKPNCSFLLFRR